MGRLTVLKQIARDLASQFGPECEIVIHDLKTNDPEHSIVHIENGHVTGRGIGDGNSIHRFNTYKSKCEQKESERRRIKGSFRLSDENCRRQNPEMQHFLYP